MMNFKSSLALGLSAVLGLLAALFAVGYWLNFPGVHSLLGQVHDALGQVLGALFAGLTILFFTGLVLGMAWCAIELRRRSGVTIIGHSKHGPMQAIIHNGQVHQLATPAQQQLDPMQQLAMLKNVLQMQSQMQQLARREVVEVEGDRAPQIAGALPTNVRYEEVRDQVPRGHILVGMGRLGIETKDRAVGALLWIVGLSGTGKTSTTVLRVEERHADGHQFLGIDPHWFKPDSLTNAVAAYAGSFLKPMAQTPEASKAVLQAFLDEFNGRKGGRIPKPWQKITLLVDEVGALMDPTTPEEEEVKELLPKIARICGQEARNFNMGGIFISQQATGLAWLRKLALMVIVHQLLMQSEKELACNGDKAAAKDMETWPIGRTYVYGVGFQDGPRTVQQPFYDAPIVDSTATPVTDRVSSGPSSNSRAVARLEDVLEEPEDAWEGRGRTGRTEEVDYTFELKKMLREAGRLRAQGVATDAILRQLGLKAGGRNNQEMQALLDMFEQTESEG